MTYKINLNEIGMLGPDEEDRVINADTVSAID